MLHPALHEIRGRLAAERPGEAAVRAWAAVAVLLRVRGDEPELLLIRRAEREGDPWSGHMALPGGRRDPGDAEAAATAVRETHEELGIDLAAGGVPLGALDPVEPRGSSSGLLVAPFVWAVPPATPLRPNAEVALAFWVPLAELASRGAAAEYLHLASGRRFPALACGGQLVWGMTHRVVTELLRIWTAPQPRT
ncbi:MAG: CoA pyrophosphatase [Gemmatimonadota bacterium]|jgi:8-oxo-dGTP pyrophosphatase MutT (NUDIX family)|nr:CoA pyrophosphatase [Gemmatimonadota bacterium]